MRSPTLYKIGAVAMLLGSLALTARPASAQEITDEFNGDAYNAAWTLNDPGGQGTFTVEGGQLKIALPDVAADDWNGVQSGARLELDPPAGDFTMTGKIDAALNAEGNPLEGRNYHSVLFLWFSDTEKLYWGPYRSNGNVRLERSTVGSVGEVATSGLPRYLQVIRTGNTYHFFHKTNEADPWTELANASGAPITVTMDLPLMKVGIMQKTWEGVAIEARWDRFSLVSGQTVFSNVKGTVTTNGPSPAKVGVQMVNEAGTVLGTTQVAADGKYSLPATAGNYTVRLIGTNVASPAAETSKAVTVVGGQDSTVDFSGIQVLGDLNPATDEKFHTDFAGPNLDPFFSLDMPKPGATIAANSGLQFTLPEGVEFDYWDWIDQSPKVRIPAPNGDFNASVKITGTDPDGNPLTGNFNIYLAIKFDKFQSFLYTLSLNDANLEGLRTGGGNQRNIPIAGSPVWVQVRKVGFTYTFYYKLAEADEWLPLTPDDATPVHTITDLRDPVQLELGVKTWGGGLPVKATFSDFDLEAVKIGIGNVTGTVAANPNTALPSTSIQFTNAAGKVMAVVPVLEGGAYNAPLLEGTYTATLIGNEVAPNQPGATQQVTVTAGQATTLNFTATLFTPLVEGQGVKFTDAFNATTLKSEWTPEINAAGPAFTPTANGLDVVLPASRTFDVWSNVPPTLPRLLLPNPGGDFVMSATINSVENTTTGDPLDNLNFHSGLTVDLGSWDAIMWGVYRLQNTLRLERSGAGFDPNVIDIVLPVQLQIRRSENDYTFWYRQTGTDPWTQLLDANGEPRIITVRNPAEQVGIYQKTWENLDLTANWSDFSLESAGAPSVPTGCLGNVTDDNAVDVQDAVAILRHVVNLGDPLTGQKLINANVNGDAGVDVQDAVIVLQAIVDIAPGNTIITKLTCPG